MPITPEQYREMLVRTEGNKLRHPVPGDAVEDEGGLHDEIWTWIRAQSPLPAFIHSRMDRKSTQNKGVPDWVIFWKGKVFLIECKTKTGKRRPDQLAWALLAELNGFKVFECRSKSEFLSIVNS